MFDSSDLLPNVPEESFGFDVDKYEAQNVHLVNQEGTLTSFFENKKLLLRLVLQHLKIESMVFFLNDKR